MSRWLSLWLLLLSAVVQAAEPMTGAVRLMWEAPQRNTDGTPVQDLKGYHLHLGLAPGTYDRVMETTDTTYDVTDLTPGATYYSVVTALDVEGNESRLSAELQFVAPGAPPPLVSMSILYTWTLTSTVETGVRVQRKTDTGGYVTIGEVGQDVSAYLDTRIEPGHDYCYRSIAWNAVGTAASGAEVCISTHPKPPTSRPASTKGGAAALKVSP